MGGKGPASKPTAIKKAAGNPGRRPLPVNEPQSKRVLPAMPRFKNAETTKEWKREVPEFYDMGVLTIADVGRLLRGFECLDNYWTLKKAVNREGWTFKDPRAFPPSRANPKVKQMQEERKEYVNILRGFGGDPSSRTRVVVDKKKADDNPFSVFEVVPGGKK